MDMTFSSKIGPIITRYLTLKKTLGRRYLNNHAILKELDTYLSTTGEDLTVENFSTWCYSHQHLSTTGRREKMRIVYNLCLYRQRSEPGCFVPNPLQFPSRGQPIQPHIFTESEIIRLFEATKQISDGLKLKLRQDSVRLALVLFYTTGIRYGELSRLTIKNYDPKDHTLLIHESKFHKSRLIPLSKDGWTAIEEYLEKRRRYGLPISENLPLICNNSDPKKSYSKTNFWRLFKTLFKIADVRTITGKKPRIQDFRHCFAVHALLRWYRNNEDVQSKLPFLAKYMGHVSIVSTQYYLRFIEPIVNSAGERFEKLYSPLFDQENREED